MLIKEKANICIRKVDEVRKVIQNPWLKSKMMEDVKIFNHLLVSLDALEECYLSFNEYESLGDITGKSGGYLYISGLLQTLYLSTDCIKNLYEIIVQKVFDPINEFSSWHLIRETRNDVIGHPTFRDRKKTMNFIDRSSISKEGFSYYTYFHDSWKVNISHVNLNNMLSIGLDQSKKILDRLFVELEFNIEDHFKSYKGMKLQNTLSGIDYNISKLILGATTEYALTIKNLDEITACFKKSFEELSSLYPNLTVLPGLFHTKDDIEYILKRLTEWTSENNFLGNRDVLIFLDALMNKVIEYRSMLAEIENSL